MNTWVFSQTTSISRHEHAISVFDKMLFWFLLLLVVAGYIDLVNRLVEGIWYHNDFSITRFSIMIARMITLILARCIITERRLRYNVDNGGATADAKSWTKWRLHTFRHLTDTSRYFSGNCSRYLEVLVNDWIGNCQVLGMHMPNTCNKLTSWQTSPWHLIEK